MVGVVDNTSLLLYWRWSNIGLTLKFQQLKKCCWPNVGLQLRTNWLRGFWVVGPMMAQCMLADCNGFIFFNTIVILIKQQLGESKDSSSHLGPMWALCHIWKRVFRIKSAYAEFIGLKTLDRWKKITSSQRHVSTLG